MGIRPLDRDKSGEMSFRTLRLPSGFGDRFGGNWRPQQRPNSSISASSADGAATGRGSYFQRVKGFQGPWKAALTSGSLSATGDLLAQFMQQQLAKKNNKQPANYDPSRTLRMFGFGLAIYGPLQYYWYNLLDFVMPVKTTGTFLAKVAANQLVLAPVTVSSVLSWNLAWLNQAEQIPDKLKSDMVPTMMNGWKFWIPAASINFYTVPLQYQVLYMSCCGVLWTAYLSYASSVTIRKPATA